ncbi:MAG: ADP-ribosylglycohydrolase family protein, partial [Candidatus Sumerlaeota bacterium]|nr:ADP-ribosylglycohydrolase family protein [Candidatus Sumerlaeota bacterium]
EFYKTYEGGRYLNYGQSQANEIVSKGLAVFAISKGDPRRAVFTAVNFGRDTDCLAAVAGGLAGALCGTEAIPAEWIEQVDEATRCDPYTNNRRTIQDTAEALFAAYMARRRRMAEQLATMDAPGHLA